MGKQQHIVITANSDWNIYNFRRSLISSFLREGFKVSVVCPKGDYWDKINELKDVDFYELKSLSPTSKSVFKEYAFFRELKKIYLKIVPSIVLHYTIKPNIIGSLVCRKLHIPSIATVTGLGYVFLNPSYFNNLVMKLYGVAFRKVDRVVFQNNDDRKIFEYYKWVRDTQCRLIRGSGVDVDYFSPKHSVLLEGKTVFLFVGRLLKDKGVLEYLEAASEFVNRKDVEFRVVGDTATDNPSLIDSKSLKRYKTYEHINFLGPSHDVRKSMSNVDFVVLPSYREGMPRVVLEAMAMGKAIITTDTAGCRDTVVNENGFLVPIKDVTALQAVMKKAIDLPKNEIKVMGQNSRNLVTNQFSNEIVNDSYITEIRGVLG